MEDKKELRNSESNYEEKRHVVIYGYTKQELNKIIKHFENQLPEYVKITVDSSDLVTKITLTGVNSGVELLRFKMNKYHNALNSIFSNDIITSEDKSISEVLGEALKEHELTVSSAESCTGGNIAHRITQIPGSSAYFMGSVVSYSNNVKAQVLNVSRDDIARYGAVSRPVVEQMAAGVANVMHSDCAIATSGIAGPDGGTKFKPVGTVWIAVKYKDQLVAECCHFKGNRIYVIEAATNHSLVMLINLLRNKYEAQEDLNDD